MRSQFSRRTRFIISSVISLLAAGSGIIALLNYLHSPTPKLKPLTVNSMLWPQAVPPGEAVTITVSPMAPNETVIPGTAVVISNFSSYDSGGKTGSWEDESRGFTDATGTFRLRFTTPQDDHWNNTKFTIDVSKDGYRRAETEDTVWRKR